MDAHEFAHVKTIEDFLKHIHLEQYSACVNSYFATLSDFVQNVNLEDLEEIGLRKLGHQKKLMLTIKMFKCKPSPIEEAEETKSSISSWSLAKSLENLKQITNEITTLARPVPPARIESNHHHNKSASTLSYATLPRNLSSSSNRRFHANLNLDTAADASMLIQQLVPTPPAMPLISISPVGKTLASSSSSSKHQIGSMPSRASSGVAKFSASDLAKPTLTKNEIMNGGGGTMNKHVLNDIDSMLCDLNRQLDEMLDYEKVIFRV